MPIDDRNDLESIDQNIRINELKEKIREVTGKEFVSEKSPDCPPEIEEQFLKQVAEYESDSYTTKAEVLK